MGAWHRFRAFVSHLYSDWLGLMSGIAGVILAVLGGMADYSFPPWAVWPVAYLCLVVAAYRVWAMQYLKSQALEQQLAEIKDSLKPISYDAEREAEIRNKLTFMLPGERMVIRRIRVCGQMTDQEIDAYCQDQGHPVVVGEVLRAKASGFLDRRFSSGGLYVVDDRAAIVDKVLHELCD